MKKKKKYPALVIDENRKFGKNDIIGIAAGGIEKWRFYHDDNKEVEEILVDKPWNCPFVCENKYYGYNRIALIICKKNLKSNFPPKCPLKTKTFIVRLK